MKNERVERLVTDLTWCSEGGEHAWVLWTMLEDDRIVVDCDNCQEEIYRGPTLSTNSTGLIIGALPVTVTRCGEDIQINPR